MFSAVDEFILAPLWTDILLFIANMHQTTY